MICYSVRLTPNYACHMVRFSDKLYIISNEISAFLWEENLLRYMVITYSLFARYMVITYSLFARYMVITYSLFASSTHLVYLFWMLIHHIFDMDASLNKRIINVDS